MKDPNSFTLFLVNEFGSFHDLNTFVPAYPLKCNEDFVL